MLSVPPLRKLKSLLLYLTDFFIFATGYGLGLFLTYLHLGGLSAIPERNALLYGSVLLLCIIVVRVILNIYLSIWRFPHTLDYLRLLCADAIAGLLAYTIVPKDYLPVPLFGATLISLLILIITLTSRWVYRVLVNRQNRQSHIRRIKVAIIGAGNTGAILADDLLHNTKSAYTPCCFIDTDTHKVGMRICGIPVYGENANTLDLLRKLQVQEIFVAISEDDPDRRSTLYDFYKELNCPIKIYDSPVRDYGTSGADSSHTKRRLRQFSIEDLLFRETHELPHAETMEFLKNKTVLVTGGGGSIGSELCRQIARCAPARLVVLDIYENNAYDIQQELHFDCPNLDLCVEIASVRDVDRINAIFAHYRPDVVFHAAAHKHVPLMEHSCAEAIKNNVFGTYNTANAAERYGVQKFILISTDKAVNPTNIMGASKRMCEMVVCCRSDSKTSFSAVRFGNVLGSNGSVIPLFRRQIEAGGPITLTDRRIIRYFMTIPEAAQLVMHAGALAKSGELFVLDMGKPVKIAELAENMIRLSGLTPNVDIEIKEVGLRPGEKLYEELLTQSESLSLTQNKMIFIEKGAPLSRQEVEDKLALLQTAIFEAKDALCDDSIKDVMKQVVPTYRSPEETNATAQQSKEMQMV